MKLCVWVFLTDCYMKSSSEIFVHFYMSFIFDPLIKQFNDFLMIVSVYSNRIFSHASSKASLNLQTVLSY